MTETCRFCDGTGKQLSGWAGTPSSRDCLACAPLRLDARALYRKTALVKAEQFLPHKGQIPAGVYSSERADPRKNPLADWMLNTLEGPHVLRNGDYICTGPAGEKWNVASEVFEATYERAAPPASDAAVPAEFVLVPVEPTTAMIQAVWKSTLGGSLLAAERAARAMIAAAPKVASDTYSAEDEALYTRWLAGDETLLTLHREQHLRFQARSDRETKERAR